LEKNFVESGEASFDADALFLRGFGPLKEVRRHVADGSKVGGSVALSDAAFVFAVDNVEDPMKAVLDAPMLACSVSELTRIRGDGGDVEADVASRRVVTPAAWISRTTGRRFSANRR